MSGKPQEPLLHGGKVVSNARLAVILGAATAVGPLAIDMYLPSLPGIARFFSVDMARAQITLSVFFLGLALAQVFYGPLSDRFGRRPLLLFGLALYALASAGCALSTSVEMLTLMRFLQACGACSGMVIGMAVVRDRFAPVEGAHMLSRMMLIMGAAPILAPFIGGFILSFSDWRGIFSLLTVYGMVLTAAVALYLPETRPATMRGPSSVWQALKVYAGLLMHRRFMGYAMTRALAQAGIFSYLTGAPFVFIELHDVPPQYFGVLFALNAVGIIGASQVNVRLLRRYAPERILRGALTGICLCAVPLIGAALLPLSLGLVGFAALLLPLFVMLSLTGLAQPNSVVMALAPFGDRAGSASALLGCIMFATASFASSMVAALSNHSALPMALTMALSGWAGAAFYHLMAKTAPGDDAEKAATH